MRTVGLLAVFAAVIILVIADATELRSTSHAGPDPRTDARPAEAKASSAPPQAVAGQDPPFALPDRSGLSEPNPGFFSTQSWEPPPPPPSRTVAPPPRLPAPPIPYRFAGRLLQDGRLSFYLSKGDAVFPVKVGETLDGSYRVDSVSETQIDLTYLPLGEKQSIPVLTSLGTTTSPAPVATPAPNAPFPRADVGAPIPTSRVIAAPATAPPTAAAKLAWGGPPQVKLGTRFEVTLRVNSDQPLHAWPMQLRFDPQHFEVVTVKPGKLLGGADPNFSYRVNPDGSIFVGASMQSGAPAADTELLALTLLPVKTAPSAELSIASVNLQGAAGRPIPHDRIATFRTAITP